MSSSETPSPTSSGSEPKPDRVEARRMMDEATFIDDRGYRRMKPKEWMDCVVVPLPEACNKKASELSTSGREIDVLVNGFPITKYPKKPVYMYEVSRNESFQALVSDLPS